MKESTSDDLGRFNVMKFGARGDGETDDTQAFQAALDTAAEVRGTVYVPVGTYRVGKLVARFCFDVWRTRVVILRSGRLGA